MTSNTDAPKGRLIAHYGFVGWLCQVGAGCVCGEGCKKGEAMTGRPIQMSEKSPAITELLESITGVKRDGLRCIDCKTENVGEDDFRDALSRKEFSISQLCQDCQDKVFYADPPEDDEE